MKKKKLAVFLLVMVMVLSLALTALVGCKNDDDTDEPTVTVPEGYKAMSQDLSRALGSALTNSVANKLLNNISINASLTVDTKYKDAQAGKYSVNFGGTIALNTEDENESEFGLQIKDEKADANLITLYYKESDENVLVETGSEKAENVKLYEINAVSIKEALASKEKGMSDKTAEDISEKTTAGIEGILKTLDLVSTTVGGCFQSEDNNVILVRFDLVELLGENGRLAPFLGMVDQYTEALGLGLTGEKLGETLPALNLDLKFKLSGAKDNDFSSAVIAGVGAELSVDKKDVTIKRNDEKNSTFVHVNIPNNCELDLGLNFEFNPEEVIIPKPSTTEDAINMNALNFSLSAELELKDDLYINLPAVLPDNISVPIIILADTYTIDLAVNVNPFALLKMNLDGDILSILAEVFSLDTGLIDYFNLRIVSKTDEDRVLNIIIAETRGLFGTSDPYLGAMGECTFFGDSGAVDENGEDASWDDTLGGILMMQWDFSQILGWVKGLIGGGSSNPTTPPADSDDNTSGDNASGETKPAFADSELAKTLKGIFQRLTIDLAEGKLDVDYLNQYLNSNVLYYDTDSFGDEITDADGNKIVKKDFGNTTLDATLDMDKDGLTFEAKIKNIVAGLEDKFAVDPKNEKPSNLTAKLEIDFATKDVKLTVNTENMRWLEKDCPINLVLTFNLKDFTIGTAFPAED